MNTASSAAPGDSRRVLTLLFVGVLMAALDIAIVGPALPALRAHFGVDERAASWVFTIYVLFNLIGTPIMGKLSDRIGRRHAYVIALGLFALGSLLVAFAPSFDALLAGRAVQAFGAGGIFPVASAVIGDVIAPDKRGSALGLLGAVFGIAFLLGPFLAAALLRFGWEWLFLVNLPIVLPLMVASLRMLPDTRAANALPFDWAGALLVAASLTGLAVAITNVDTHALGASVASTRVWPWLLLAVAAGLAAGFALRRAADPLLRPAWFASRQIRLVALFAAGAGLGEAAMVFLPDFAVSSLGLTAQASSYVLLPVVLALAVASPLFGRMIDRIGPKPIVATASAMLAAGAACIAVLPASLATLIVAGALVGVGLGGLLGAPLRYILLQEIPAAERGASQSIVTVFTSVGQLVAGALIGGVAASGGGGAVGYREAFAVVAVAVSLLVFASMGLSGKSSASPLRSGAPG